MVNRFYISDLDGTLLHDDGVLTNYTKQRVTQILAQDIPFSVATARDIRSVRRLFAGIPFRYPVITSDGAFIFDAALKLPLHIQALNGKTANQIARLIFSLGVQPLVSSHKSGKDFLFYTEVGNEGMRVLFEDLREEGDSRLTPMDKDMDLTPFAVTGFTLINKRAILEPVLARVLGEFGHILEGYIVDGLYNPEWAWVKFHDRNATKGDALGVLADITGFSLEQTTVFGDSLNDIQMFQRAGRAVAVENSLQEVKSHAQMVIRSNRENSVVDFIAREADLENPSPRVKSGSGVFPKPELK